MLTSAGVKLVPSWGVVGPGEYIKSALQLERRSRNPASKQVARETGGSSSALNSSIFCWALIFSFLIVVKTNT